MKTTRDTLLDLGEQAIRSRGFAGFSYADLVRDAGIRKASVHHHFPAKADLGLALVERYATGLLTAFSEISANSANAGEAMRGAISLHRAALKDGTSACLCAALATDTALLDEPTRQALEATNDATKDWFEGVYRLAAEDGSLDMATNPASEAAATLALLQGAQLLAKASGSVSAFDDATATLSIKISG
ncbi:MAG: TetR/AcrR family transcriptional regulator [Erythrobacter sp.]|uniref:TetR/AcrR family transcriptional regulator n=1 Tax=Erythrobacter sp. TaxID=1042 RepID=UPI003267DF27